ALAVAVAKVWQPERLPRQASDALVLAAVATLRSARRFGPAVVVEVRARQVAGSHPRADGAVRRVCKQGFPGLRERAIACLGAARRRRGELERGEGEDCS